MKSANSHHQFQALFGAALGLASFLILQAAVGTARADTWTEQGDAGDLPLTAQVVSGAPATSLTKITGTITLNLGISEADLYEIYINSPTTFSATTTGFVPGSNNWDTQLFLFNAAGMGVFTNDDDTVSGGEQSTLPGGTSFMSSLPAGIYYLLIDGSGRYPANSLSQAIFPNFTDGTTDSTGVYGATGPGGSSPFATYSGNSNAGGNYSIALTGAQFVIVPEPSAFALLALGAAGLVWLARRRSAAQS